MTRPFRLALTGGIAMGKSTAARMFADEGVPVFDADAAVHRLYGGEIAAGVVARIETAFPGVTTNGAVDREALSARVLNDVQALRRLEAIVHPAVAAARADFLVETEAAGAPLVLFDVPLLFETGLEREADAVAVVTAPACVQRARALARPGMTPERLDAILARQMPDAEKRARADHVIRSDEGLEAMRGGVREVVRLISAHRG